MNITNDIEEKWKKKVLSEQEDLAKDIDPWAFESDKYYDNEHLPIAIYFRERRMKANILAGKLYNAGYRKIMHE